MTAILFGVLATSLVGSVHCAGMCGPLVLFSNGGERPRPAALWAYHLARLSGYVLLGLVAGTVGAAVDLGGQWAGIGQVAAVLAGVFMMVASVVALIAPSVRHAKQPSSASLLLTRLMGRAQKLGPLQRSLVIGGLTAFLPCGWLYAFLAAAASTGNAFQAALVMVAFWLGSVPMLLGLGVGAGVLLEPLRRRAPVVVPVLLFGLGLFAVSGRLRVPSFEVAFGGNASEQLLAGDLQGEPLPCCAAKHTSVEPATCPHVDTHAQGESCDHPDSGNE